MKTPASPCKLIRKAATASLVVCALLISGGYLSQRVQEGRERVVKIAEPAGPVRSQRFPKVSLAEIAPDVIVTADYNKMQLTEVSTGKSCFVRALADGRELVPPRDLAELLDPYSEPVQYSPTGVFSDKAGELFVANYKANNVLHGTIDTSTCQFQVTRTYVSEHAIGPENVAVSREHNILLSANYDSGKVVAFALDSGEYLWRVPIGQAHGITASGSKAFATGLTERKLYEIDLARGAVIRSVGELGWDPALNQYLWPTTVHAFGSHELVIADAHTGKISFVDKSTFRPKRTFGGNGPGRENFNYPYAALPYRDGLLVLSSYSDEAHYLPNGDPSAKRTVYVFSDRAPHRKPEGQTTKPRSGYVQVGDVVNILGASYSLGFGSVQGKDGRTFQMPNIGSTANAHYYMYFMQGSTTGDGRWTFLMSSASDSLLAVSARESEVPLLVRYDIGLDSWLESEGVLTRNGALHVLQYARPLLEVKAEVNRRISANGWLKPNDLAELGGLNALDSAALDRSFPSSSGRRFKLVYDRCNQAGCAASEIRAAAESYYDQTRGKANLALDEYVLVGMISGVAPHEVISGKAQRFAGCDGSEFYPNAGIEALSTESLDDYLSARNLSSSILCFESPREAPAQLTSLAFIWYSPSEAASRVKITALEPPSLPGDEVVVDLPAPKTVGGFALSRIRIPEIRPAKRFQLRLLEGGAQKRLLLRHISAEFDGTAHTVTVAGTGGLGEIVRKVHNSITYGPRELPASIDNLDQFRAFIRAGEIGDCGIYTFLFADAIDGMYRWQTIDLKTRDGRVHSVAEVFTPKGVETADPTLGIMYKCSVESMILGSCADREYNALVLPDPILRAYHGAGFFYGAHVIRKYRRLDEFVTVHNASYAKN